MDSRAKQRLTGAVILVALFVLLVPELLTGPRDGGGDAPSEEGMRRYTIDLDAASSGAQPMAPAQPAPAVSLPPVAEHSGNADDSRASPGEAARPAAAEPPAAVTPTPNPATAAAAPLASAPQARAPTAAPPAASAPKPVAPAVVSNPVARPDASRPAPAAATAPSGARGAFAVQLGSFVSRENAERLVREMTAKGFNAFVAPPIMTNGRELYRVRVGPTRDRASAEALATQLRRIGQGGSIVSIS